MINYSIYLTLLMPLMAIFCLFLSKERSIKFIVNISALLIFIITFFNALYFYLNDFFVINILIDDKYINLYLDLIGMLFIALISTLFLINCIYSVGYMDACKEQNQRCFYICLFLSLFAVFIIGYSGNLLIMFTGYELLTISTLLLVSHKGDKKSQYGMNIYLGILIGTSIMLFLPSIIWIFKKYNTLNFVINGFIQEPSLILILLLIWGVAKSAIFPVYQWLPAAMVAPVPVSAFLHAVAVVNAGVFVLYRIFINIFDYATLHSIQNYSIIPILIGITMIYSSIMALMQNNLKARLAYSTINQLAYMNLCLIILPSTNMFMLYMYGHSLAKIVLFFTTGMIYIATKKTMIDELNGIGKNLPITCTIFSLAAFGIIGYPIGIIFWLKEILFHHMYGMLFILIFVSSFLSVLYLFPLIIRMFYMENNTEETITESSIPLSCFIASIIPILISIIIFFIIGMYHV